MKKIILFFLMSFFVCLASRAHYVCIYSYPLSGPSGRLQIGTDISMSNYSDDGLCMIEAEAGETIYFSFEPFDGYWFTGTIAYDNLSSADVTELPGGIYSFTMPNNYVKIYVEFEKIHEIYSDVIIDENNFPDSNFRDWLLSQSYGTDSIISGHEIAHVINIIAEGCGIEDLTGIEHFPELTRLMVGNFDETPEDSRNRIKSLDLSSNPKMTFLSCNGNMLDTIDLSYTPTLTDLHLGGNYLTQIDLTKTPELQTLSCDNNLLTELDVTYAPKLYFLGCTGNQLTELNVSNNPLLTDLLCYDNRLTTIDLTNQTELRLLKCFNNQLTSLDVSSCPNLYQLYIWDNQIKGKAMDDFINSLPYYPYANLVVVNLDSYNEQNIITKEQVAAVKEKGWSVEAIFDDGFILYDGTFCIIIDGDVDGDGNVTSADITALYNYLLNNDETGIVNGDIDGDGYITSADITSIYNILLGNNNGALK